MFINLNLEQIGKKQGFVKALGPTQIRTHRDCSNMHSASMCVHNIKWAPRKERLELKPQFLPQKLSQIDNHS